MTGAARTHGPRGALGVRDFRRLFVGDAASMLGTTISALAIQFLLIDTLHADQLELGIVRGAQWAPYLVFGLVAGVLVDRVRRRPLLVAADLVSAAVMTSVGVLALTGHLTMPLLAVHVFVLGSLTCASVAGFQSFVPRLVPSALLPDAFARLEQMSATTEAGGPLAAGALVRFVGAPVGVLVDAVSYVVSALMIRSIRTEEPAAAPSADRHLLRELREGARWVYRHEQLRPYALWLHSWFFFSTIATTILVFDASRRLQLDPLTVGLALAVSGVVGVVAAGYGPRLDARYGVGRVITTVEWASPLWPLVVASASPGPWALPMLVVSQLLYGLRAMTGGLMMAHRTAITPDHLRARMNATIRTFNWGGIAIAAPLSGWVAGTFGDRAAYVLASLGLAVATAGLALSPYRRAVTPPS